MTIKKTLNKDEATRLFYENAVLIGSQDGIPDEAVIALLGEEALDFVVRVHARPSERRVGYGIGSHTEMCLPLQGFFVAVTHHNITTLLRERKEREGRNEN